MMRLIVLEKEDTRPLEASMPLSIKGSSKKGKSIGKPTYKVRVHFS